MGNEVIEVLLAEDNDDDILMIEEGFAETGLLRVAHVAHNGNEALDQLHSLSRSARLPGLVLLDINMPLRNGFEVMEAMKLDPTLRHIPVVVLTSSSREADIVRAYASGACSYLNKPMGYDRLLTVVEEFAGYWGRVCRVPSSRGPA
jgi:CheY-like chemotaxis protein